MTTNWDAIMDVMDHVIFPCERAQLLKLPLLCDHPLPAQVTSGGGGAGVVSADASLCLSLH